MQFRDFLDILRNRWKILLTSVVLVLAATIGVTLTTTPVYQASTRIFLSTSSTGFVISESDVQTYIELVGSPVLLDPLRETLDLPPGTPIDVSATSSENTNLMTVTARSSSAQRAADIANAVGPELAKIGGDFSPLLASAGQGVESTTITPASVPRSPVSPDLQRNILLGLLAGLALGIGAVLLRHFLDTKVRIEADVKALSDRPMLGALRRLTDADVNPLVVESEPHGVAAEEFRRLRTNLRFADITTGRKHSFVITSAMPSEGKTLTAINLARTMADSGARVLLVDGDLRHPSVANTLGLEGSVGLTTILLEQASVDDVAQQWGETSLHVLPAGEIPPNPSELIGSEAMEELFSEFMTRYDFVIVDSPPVVPVADPVLISHLVGGLLMVVCLDRSRKRDLATAIKALRTADIEPSGFALNMVQGGDGYCYGKYGYHYAYGQGSSGTRKRSGRAASNQRRRNAGPGAPAPGRPSRSRPRPSGRRPGSPVRRRRRGRGRCPRRAASTRCSAGRSPPDGSATTPQRGTRATGRSSRPSGPSDLGRHGPAGPRHPGAGRRVAAAGAARA